MKLNWSDLIRRFNLYLAQTQGADGAQKQYAQDDTSSIFDKASEFKKYLKEEYDIDSASVSMMDILQKQVQNSKIVTSDNEKEDEGVIFDMVNELMAQDNVKTIVDSNSDGNLDKDEISIFLKSINNYDGDTKNISLDDIIAVTDSIKNGTFKLEEEQEIQGPEPEPEAMEVEDAGGGGGGGEGSQGGGVVEKTLDNMTKEELNQELTNAQNQYDENKTAYEAIMNGSDEQSKALQENIDKAYETYQQELKNVDEVLAQKLDEAKTAVDEKEQQISAKEIEITNQEMTVSTAETNYNNAVSTREQLESSLNSLKTESPESDEDKQQVSSMISSLESQIEAAKQAEQQAKETWDKEVQTLEDLKSQKTNLETDLTGLKENMQQVEDEIAQSYPQMKEYMENYKQAKEDLQTYKTQASSKAKSDMTEAQSYVNQVQSAITNYDNRQVDREYSLSKAKGSYSLNGVDFATVLPDNFEDISQFAKLITDLGMTNLGPWGTKQCFNYSQAYGAYIMNDTGVNFFADNAAYQATKREWNQRPFKQMTMPTQQAAFSEMKAELDAGRPVVAKIYSSDKSMTHYGLIVGYNKNAGDNLQESDFLLLDSYDGNIEQMGSPRHFNGYKTALWFYQKGYSYTGF